MNSTLYLSFRRVFIAFFLVFSLGAAAQTPPLQLLKQQDTTYVQIRRTYEKTDELFKVTDTFVATDTPQEIFYTNTKPTVKNNYALRPYANENLVYYPDGQLAEKAFYKNGRPEGEQIYYTTDGKKRSFSVFNKGALIEQRTFYPDETTERANFYGIREGVDSVITYFENGNVALIKLMQKNKNSEPYSTTDIILDYFTENGEQLIKNGNGYYIEKDSLGNIVDSGKYKNGLKDSVWVGTMEGGKANYREIYQNGAFIRGEVTDNLGKQHTYEALEIQPQFQDGIKEMYQFIAKNIKYPKEAQMYNISGRVFCKFVVEKDGTIDEVVAIKGVHPSLDNEAKRVVKAMSGQWNPGYQHGLPVRVYYTMPIVFRLE